MCPIAMNENARHWARMELARWAGGEYPADGNTDNLDVPAAALLMADAMEQGNPSNFPTITNTINVIRYLAEQLESKGDV